MVQPLARSLEGGEVKVVLDLDPPNEEEWLEYNPGPLSCAVGHPTPSKEDEGIGLRSICGRRTVSAISL